MVTKQTAAEEEKKAKEENKLAKVEELIEEAQPEEVQVFAQPPVQEPVDAKTNADAIPQPDDSQKV